MWKVEGWRNETAFCSYGCLISVHVCVAAVDNSSFSFQITAGHEGDPMSQTVKCQEEASLPTTSSAGTTTSQVSWFDESDGMSIVYMFNIVQMHNDNANPREHIDLPVDFKS